MMETVDKDTGEIKQKGKSFSWIRLEIAGCEMLALKNLTKNEHRVLMMLFSRMSFNNRIFVNKTVLANDFGCSRAMVSRTMSMLEKKDIIERTGRAYKVNNSYIRCG